MRILRETADMTRDELAALLGVGSEHLHAIERGSVTPSKAFLATAAAVLATRLREQQPEERQ